MNDEDEDPQNSVSPLDMAIPKTTTTSPCTMSESSNSDLVSILNPHQSHSSSSLSLSSSSIHHTSSHSNPNHFSSPHTSSNSLSLSKSKSKSSSTFPSNNNDSILTITSSNSLTPNSNYILAEKKQQNANIYRPQQSTLDHITLPESNQSEQVFELTPPTLFTSSSTQTQLSPREVNVRGFFPFISQRDPFLLASQYLSKVIL
eukprot:c15992_g2_i1.p1 GENE.c15992_g2_i1~~c15992_g2_i1.p1  ORF type:complete len:203 (-),score=50.14 c15992_g2_i1:44-652(-)